ncbi:hypothetical protein D3C71_1915950 [compost metagenome]
MLIYREAVCSHCLFVGLPPALCIDAAGTAERIGDAGVSSREQMFKGEGIALELVHGDRRDIWMVHALPGHDRPVFAVRGNKARGADGGQDE